MDIFVLSKRRAMEWKCQEPHIWISINDPNDSTRLPINEWTKETLVLHFDDAESDENWKETGFKDFYNRDCILFNESMALQVFDFFNKHKDIENLLIHCHGGISRSAGVGSFLSQVIGKSQYQTPPHFPNPLVRRMLRRVWKEKTGILIP